MSISKKMHTITKNDLWETPKKEYEYYCALLDIFPKLDVCATAKNSKCKKFFTESNNSLNKEWNDDFFMNPPLF